MKKTKSCGAVVLKKENHEYLVLVIRQNQGHWCFPKGHVIEGESEQETALREVFEETGVKLTIREGFKVSTHYSPRPNEFKEVVYFIGDYQEGEIKLQDEEVQDSTWSSFIDAMALITYDDDANILRKALQFLKETDPLMEEEE